MPIESVKWINLRCGGRVTLEDELKQINKKMWGCSQMYLLGMPLQYLDTYNLKVLTVHHVVFTYKYIVQDASNNKIIGFSVMVVRNEWERSVWIVNGFLVSKETVVLRQWESEKKIWFYQTSLRLNYYRERLSKLTFQVLALRQSPLSCASIKH